MPNLPARLAIVVNLLLASACGDGSEPGSDASVSSDASVLSDASALTDGGGNPARDASSGAGDAAPLGDASSTRLDCMLPNGTCRTGTLVVCSEGQGGTVVPSCPAADRQGTCTLPPNLGLTVIYYKGANGASWSDRFSKTAKDDCELSFQGMYQDV